MRKSLLILGLLAVALPQLIASPENDAIITVAESYLTANATVTTKVKYIVERIEGDVARVRINPADKPSSSTVWIFLKKKDGNWTAISARASFTAKEYEDLGIPKSLQIPH
ncbi:MAG: hypothetical protein QOE26_2337 [Verrucomicrobiota bacterium]|jgi:hypothetical protein